MNSQDQKIISHTYADKEGYKSTYEWFLNLKRQGLNPLYITMDGERSVIRAIKAVWPYARIQRCLFHIQREGMRWLRTYPKTEAGKALRRFLRKICFIRSIKEQDEFITGFNSWLQQYKGFVISLPKTEVAYKDLQRTIILISNAIPDMFHYLTQSQMHHTTNALEGFHSRLKSDYQRHRGLTNQHKIGYLNWYCYYKNQ